MSQPTDTEVAAQPPAARGSATQWRTAVVVVLGLAVLGLLVGFLWGEYAPRVVYTVIRKGLAEQQNSESERQFAADGWFALVGAGIGLVTGLLAWSRRSVRGPVLLLALVAGSFAGALVAWRVGVWIGRHPTAGQRRVDFATVGHDLPIPLALHAKAALFFQPFTAALVAVVWTAFTPDRLHSAPPRDDHADGPAIAGPSA